MNYNVYPKEFSRYGQGHGRLRDRDFIGKREKFELLKRQHHQCAMCKKTFKSDMPFEVGHIIPYDKGGMLYDKSTVFPEAFLPNNALVCKACNGKMGYQVDGIWAMEVAAYYGLGKISHTDHALAKKLVKEAGKVPEVWPYWLRDEQGKLRFLTDGMFNEQQYFQIMIRTYQPFEEKEDGALVPKGLGKSHFPEIKP